MKLPGASFYLTGSSDCYEHDVSTSVLDHGYSNKTWDFEKVNGYSNIYLIKVEGRYC